MASTLKPVLQFNEIMVYLMLVSFQFSHRIHTTLNFPVDKKLISTFNTFK